MSENSASNNRQVLLLKGTVTVPSLGFAGNNNTGIYSPGANQLAITNNGVQSLVFDASGNATFSGTVNFPGGGAPVTTSNTVTLTNKTINGASNTLTVRLANDVSGTLPVANGGTGAATLTGYVKGSGTSAMTASATIPATDLTGTVAVANGGTGSSTAATARTALGAAASGANTDITALDQDVTITATGTIAADTIGFRGVPQNSQSTNYTLVLADAGKHIAISSGTLTIPANSATAFPVGTAITIYNNNSSTTRSIAITTDTMYLAGTTTTGTRTLAVRGLATIVKVDTQVWVISGAGVT